MSGVASGKTSRDENFPVASWLIRAPHRPVIHAFYDFVRAADDLADDPALEAPRKLERLDALEQGLVGRADETPVASRLREELAARGLSAAHALDLLKAFRLDVVKSREADWSELMAYCALSAMPVGRFVLDVHGEDRSTWPASDAICAALQIVNHLQDCGDDFRELDRVYIPLDIMAARGAGIEDLAAKASTPELRACVADCARRVEGLLAEGAALASMVRDSRLGLEISIIHALARRLTAMLGARDPLAERVHLRKREVAGVSLGAAFAAAARRMVRTRDVVAPESP